MKRITSTDLANWAPTRDCQEHLPLLIRRLIRASNTKIQKLLIPSGDNVILPGFDGSVEAVDGTEFIPSGSSIWEIGSGKDFKSKADADFKKRIKEVQKKIALETSFVFVTPHVWTSKDEWVRNKKSEQTKWRDVKVIDGQVLEEWLEQLPSVASWFSRFIPTIFANIQPLDQFWEEWSITIKYSISISLVVYGREIQKKAVIDYLLANPSVLSIKGSTVEEVIAFITASVQTTDENLQEEIYSKAVIVETEIDFRALAANKIPMILVAKFQLGSLADLAVRNGHHIILPVSNDVTATEAGIEIPRIRRPEFEKGLMDMGFTQEEADSLTRDSGQSLSVLRRLLKFEKNHQPDWAKDGNHVDLIPALLVGRWNEEKEEDRAIVSLLAGEPYEKYISKLARWRVEKDSPIRQITSVWLLTSALDAWSILARFVTQADLENFRTAFLTVLPEINPALQLEPDKRYLASLYGKTPKFSHAIKEGLCQSLILMAIFGEQYGLRYSGSSQGFADRLVYDLLMDASGDKWCTLYSFLPLLSEASPKSFLIAVEDSLNKEEPPIMKMFGDFNNIFSSTSYYTGLLWALENLLISPQYLLKATMALVKLSRLDPGGNLSNRPINTLRSVYIPWYRQTYADMATRTNVLEKVTNTEPEIAWKLFLGISPQDHNTVSPIHQCKWRFDPQYLEREVNYEDVFHFNAFVFSQLLILAEGDEQKTADLIDFYPNINYEQRGKLLNFLKESKDKLDHSKNLVWDELRKLISQHREHSEQSWALSEEEVKKLEEVLLIYTPTGIVERFKYLFENNWISFPEGFRRNDLSHEEREKIIDERRKEAFDKIYREKGLSGILEMTDGLSSIHHLADMAAKTTLSNEEERHVLSLLSVDQENKRTLFAQAYIFSKGFKFGIAWISKAYLVVKDIFTDSQVITNFFLNLPQTRDVWHLLEQAGKEIERVYWVQIRAHLFHDAVEDKLYVIDRLRVVKRFITIIDIVAHRADEITSDLLADLLLLAAMGEQEENAKLEPYDVGKIFELLHKRGDLVEETMIKLEWIYLPFLTSSYANEKPKLLFKALAEDPNFFVEVVTYVYLPDGELKEDNYSEEEAKRRYRQASSARSLLEKWRDIPGISDGNIEVDKLKNWISKARTKAEEVKRVYGVDSEVGSLLARFPRNKDCWPPDEICEILDSLNNENILSHFRTQIYNSRGVYSKAAYEGGGQERNLSAYFKKMGDRILAKYPLTASVLLELAESYRRSARDEDDRAHLDELR